MLWNDGIFRWMVLPEFMDQRWAFRCWVVDLNIRRRKSHQHAPCSDEFGMPWCVLSDHAVAPQEIGWYGESQDISRVAVTDREVWGGGGIK